MTAGIDLDDSTGVPRPGSTDIVDVVLAMSAQAAAIARFRCS
jgi:hypothetical protein